MDNKRKFSLFLTKCVFDDRVRKELLADKVKGDQVFEIVDKGSRQGTQPQKY